MEYQKRRRRDKSIRYEDGTTGDAGWKRKLRK
jgi:hypothetical protein